MNIYSVSFAAITVKQFVSLEILGYGTSIFKIAQKMVMLRTGQPVAPDARIQQLETRSVFKAKLDEPGQVKKMLQDMTEKVQQLKDKHVELFFTPTTEFEDDELDLLKKWASSRWETNLMHDPEPAPPEGRAGLVHWHFEVAPVTRE